MSASIGITLYDSLNHVLGVFPELKIRELIHAGLATVIPGRRGKLRRAYLLDCPRIVEEPAARAPRVGATAADAAIPPLGTWGYCAIVGPMALGDPAIRYYEMRVERA